MQLRYLFIIALSILLCLVYWNNHDSNSTSIGIGQSTLASSLSSNYLSLLHNPHGNQAMFRANIKGNGKEDIVFQSVGLGHAAYFKKNKITHCYTQTVENEQAASSKYEQDRQNYKHYVWNLHLVGSSSHNSISAEGEYNSRHHYLKGNDFSRHITHVPDYEKITYEEAYEGIDIQYYGQGDLLKSDFILASHADITQIRLACEGIDCLSINDQQQLAIHTPWGTLLEEKPYSYQNINGQQQAVEVAYTLLNDTTYTFSIVGEYDVSRPLIIDPVSLEWGTYHALTASLSNLLYDINVDGDGNVYGVTASVESSVVTSGVVGEVFGGSVVDGYIFKISADGSELLFATYLGGSVFDDVVSIEFMEDDAILVAGFTTSPDFPFSPYEVIPSPFYHNGFVTKLNSTGTVILSSKLLPGSNADYIYDMTIGPDGYVYCTGITNAPAFLATAEAFSTSLSGFQDAFILKYDLATSSIIYATYLGWSGIEDCASIVVTEDGEAIVTGITDSNDFPTSTDAYDTSYNGGDTDFFVTKLNATGTDIVFSTYLGVVAEMMVYPQ